MLGKLMKYEIKCCGRTFFPFYIFVLLFSIVAGLFVNFDTYEHDFSIIYLIGVLVAFALFIAAIVLTIVIIVQRFNKSLLEDEGYLMFTLPVSENSLVLSKYLTSLLFIILTSIIGMVCMTLILTIFGYKISDVLDIKYGLETLGSIFSNNIGGIIFYIIASIADYSVFILTIYLAITICHLPAFSKHKVLSGLGALIVIMIVESGINSIVDKIMGNIKVESLNNMIIDSSFNFGSMIDLILNIGSYEIITLILNIAIAVALFFGITTLLKKKLNLE
ncbi:hypothetical protein [Intestinibacter sp.]